MLSLDADASGRASVDDDLRTQLAFARLCAHYFSRHGFLADGDIAAQCAAALRGIPGVMIHGRLDLTGPLDIAWRMAQAVAAMPGSR